MKIRILQQVDHMRSRLIEEGKWVEVPGLVPLSENRPVRVYATVSTRDVVEEFFGGSRERHLTRKERRRVVNSTLAAESQSLSKGLGDLLWMKVMIKELMAEKFNIKEWPAMLAGEETLAFARDSTSERLQECLAIVHDFIRVSELVPSLDSHHHTTAKHNKTYREC